MKYCKELLQKYETDVFVAGGGAAGVAAAALATESENVRNIDVKDLQRALIKLGAYLPNAKE